MEDIRNLDIAAVHLRRLQKALVMTGANDDMSRIRLRSSSYEALKRYLEKYFDAVEDRGRVVRDQRLLAKFLQTGVLFSVREIPQDSKKDKRSLFELQPVKFFVFMEKDWDRFPNSERLEGPTFYDVLKEVEKTRFLAEQREPITWKQRLSKFFDAEPIDSGGFGFISKEEFLESKRFLHFVYRETSKSTEILNSLIFFFKEMGYSFKTNRTQKISFVDVKTSLSDFFNLFDEMEKIGEFEERGLLRKKKHILLQVRRGPVIGFLRVKVSGDTAVIYTESFTTIFWQYRFFQLYTDSLYSLLYSLEEDLKEMELFVGGERS